jgi:hypothetical protein
LWLSPGGIWLGPGAVMVNVTNLLAKRFHEHENWRGLCKHLF